MNNYNFNKLSIEEKYQEKDKLWVKENPELYIRLLIINDDIDILKIFEKENHTISSNIKDGILLTLAMQKNSFATIDYLLEKKIHIKPRDVEALVKNFREDDKKNEFLTLLEKIDFSTINLTVVFKDLEDYLDNEGTAIFVEYLLEHKIQLEEKVIENLKEQDNLHFIFKKQQKEHDYKQMSDKYSIKKLKEKNKKI